VTKSITIAALIVLWASTARANLALWSQDWYSGSGSHFKETPAGGGQDLLTPTSLTHGAFPQDASNSITFGQNGMTVLTNPTGHLAVQTPGNLYFLNETWTVQGFSVKFSVDTPEPYSFATPNGSGGALAPFIISLVGNTTGTIFGSASTFSSSGTLQPDTYTYGGESPTFDATANAGYSPPGFFASLSNVTLTVAPEPSSLGVLLVGAAMVFRRRR
jgi:hypothetical protein